MHSRDITCNTLKIIDGLSSVSKLTYGRIDQSLIKGNSLQSKMRNYSDLAENFCRFSTHPRSHQLVVNTVAASTLYGLLFFPTVLLNGVSILTILRSSQLKKKVSYFLILLQSAIDLIFGAIALPLMIAYFIDRDATHEHSVVICWLHHIP